MEQPGGWRDSFVCEYNVEMTTTGTLESRVMMAISTNILYIIVDYHAIIIAWYGTWCTVLYL